MEEKEKRQPHENTYSDGKNDECYTPAYGIRPILPYIPADAVVWCPFDTEESEFVKLIRENGNIVIHSHISEGKDFYTYEPDVPWDMIVSNPPFTNKRKIFERALSFGKPFALIAISTWFNDSTPVNFMLNHERMQLLMLNGRIEYINYKGSARPPFASWYFCYDMLPSKLVVAALVKAPQPKLF